MNISRKNPTINLSTRQLVNSSTKNMSLFLTNATLEIEKTAVRLMPFRILRAVHNISFRHCYAIAPS